MTRTKTKPMAKTKTKPVTKIRTPTKEELPPDQRPINAIQARRLAALTGVSAKELEGQKIAQLSERLRWKIDPIFFLFRQICGRVVKKDPVTGVEYPVPFATVYVEDTDCNLISYFPESWPWGWHFPLFCHREIIGTTKTDACGNFCVWVPRFDIDWILRWRLERVCYPIIFRRPSIGDLIPRLPTPVAGPWPPGPDPGPLKNLTTLPPVAVEAIAGSAAGKLAQRVARLQATQSLGSANQLKAGLLNARAFETELPPPLPAEFHRALGGHGVVAAKGASAAEGIRSAVALKLGLNPSAKEIAGFNPQRYIGPFLRCYDIIVPEWQLILDVPDITFRVTQDVNGNGIPVTIYSEGYFDVRWDAGPLPDVTLVASAIAKETHTCETPVVPCGNVPAILFAGLMPLDNFSYFNATNGYALRPNRPSNDGATPSETDMSRPAAQTPFCETLQLYGCVNVGGAKFYRILQSTDGGATLSAITGLPLHLFTFPGGVPVTITPDVNGWYEVLANPDDYHPARMILEWPGQAPGQYVLKIELGDASKNPIPLPVGQSAPVAIQVDNTSPQAPFTTLSWKFAGDDDSTLQSLLGIPCPMIKRGATPRDIEIVFEVHVSANHLRDASLYASGCGGGSFGTVTDPLNNPSHWHTTVLDNSVHLYQRYSLAKDALAGCYSFGCTAISRAMNPDGADGGNLKDWYEDTYVLYTAPSIAVAVVNED